MATFTGNNNAIKTENTDNMPGKSPMPGAVKVRLPPFIRRDPTLWFTLVKNLFNVNGIVLEKERLCLITEELDENVLLEVSDILMKTEKNGLGETTCTDLCH